MKIAETAQSMQQLPSQTSPEAVFFPPYSVVTFKPSTGPQVQAHVTRLGSQSLTFEVSGPAPLRVSEVLNDFEVSAENKAFFEGKAVITSMLDVGATTVCEVTLSNPLPSPDVSEGRDVRRICQAGFGSFVSRWQKYYRVSHDYKVIIADLETFLSNLRLWLEQVELGFQAAGRERLDLERELAQQLRPQVTSVLSNMFERFEAIAEQIEPEQQAIHRAFGQRQLHPHLLCSPFIYRTFAKPLGYAGDYEMMNMIVRNGLEGKSLYAKLVNGYLLDQVGPQAVRNRVGYLYGKIVDETCRVARSQRTTRIFNIACGPAREAENFLLEHPLADHAQFHLLDFDAETLEYARGRIEGARRSRQLKPPVTVVRKSVSQMLRANGKGSSDEQYDLIYCSGLYDYLNDRVIKALNTYLYDQLEPGGLLTVGNFAPNMPVRNFIEHFLEWFLLYRNANELAGLAPEQASPSDCKVIAEPTGTNIFLEVRKPL